MKTLIFILFIIVLSFSSCKKSHPLQVDDYPIRTGDSWTYRFTFATYNFRPTVPGATFPTDTVVFTSTVFNRGKGWLNDSVQAWKFQCDGYFASSSDTFFSRSYNYYQKIKDTLRIVAYSGGSSLPMPKFNSSAYICTFHNKIYPSLHALFAELRGERINSITADTAINYEERPPKAFVFPLKKGNEWDYRKRGFLFNIHKKVLGTEIIQIPYGEIKTNKIQWFWDRDDNGVYEEYQVGYDYVTDDGLLKREFIFLNIGISDENHPDGQGLIDISETYELISTNSKTFFY